MRALAATRRPTVRILLAGMVLPELLLTLGFDLQGSRVAAGVRAYSEANAGNPGNFLAALEPGLQYAGALGLAMLAVAVAFMASYFALVHVAVNHFRGGEPLGTRRALGLGVRTALPAGLILVVALGLLLFVGQVLVAPAVVLAVLSLAVPVILVAEGKGALASLWDALALRYVKQSQYSGWTVLFSLMSLGAALYMAMILVALACEGLLFLDERAALPRGLWMTTFPGLSFGPLYLLVTVIESVVTMGLLATFPALTSALYFTVVGKRNITVA